jgi:hypothetical protein
MNTAFDVLVIILSATLAIFLILSIIAVSMVLKLLSSLRAVVAKGEHIVDSAEELTETLRRNAGAVSVLKLLMRYVASMNNKKEK